MRIVGCLFFLVIYSGFTYADVYKHTSLDGKVYYTDKPKIGVKYKQIIKSKYKLNKNEYKNLRWNKKKYSTLISKAAVRHNIDEKLLHAIIRAESAYNKNAISPAGAVGLMQLMPKTAERFGVTDRKNAAQNIEGGARYVKVLMKMFNSNIDLVLASYNAGEGAVRKYKNSIPPFAETQDYVRKVLGFYKKS